MPNWKKVLVSGSDAQLSNITASGNLNFFTGSIHSVGPVTSSANISASGNYIGKNNATSFIGTSSYAADVSGSVLASGKIFVGNANNDAAVVALSGDVTIDNAGAATIANNAVGLAEMAHGTDGNLITYNSSGAPAHVAVGTSGHVLTSNGAGSAPTFQAVSAGGSGIFVATGSAQSTTNQTISISGSLSITSSNASTQPNFQAISTSCASTSSFGMVRLCGPLVLGSGGIIRDYAGNTGVSIGTGTTGVVSILTTRDLQVGGGFGSTGVTIGATGAISANGALTASTARFPIIQIDGNASGQAIILGSGANFINNEGVLISRRADSDDADTDVEVTKFTKADDTEAGSIKFNESELKVKEHYLLADMDKDLAVKKQYRIQVGGSGDGDVIMDFAAERAKVDVPFTASNDISASAIDGNHVLGGKTTFGHGTVTINGPAGNVTASGNFSGSGNITSSGLYVTGNISSSGNITLNDEIAFTGTSNQIRTFDGGASGGHLEIYPDGNLDLGGDRTDNILIGRDNNTSATTKLYSGTSTVAIELVNEQIKVGAPISSSKPISASGGIIGDLVGTASFVAADAITGASIADNAINSEHYTDASIDNAHLADNAVDTAEIADNAVTLAKMAGIARGKIIIGNSSDNPALLSPGGANTVLQSDGTDISYGTIATDMIANDAVTGAKIEDNPTIAGNLTVNGTTALGNATTDTVTIAGNITASNMTGSNIDLSGDLDFIATTANISLNGSSAMLFQSTQTIFNQDLRTGDGKGIKFGAGSDYRITHAGTGAGETKMVIKEATTSRWTYGIGGHLTGSSNVNLWLGNGGEFIGNSANITNITASANISASGFIGNLTGTASFVAADAITGASIADNAINSEHYTDASIDTAHIADEQVTLAKLAHAAANTVLVRDANSAGDPSFKAVTNQQILIGDGTGFTAAALSGDATMGNDGAVTLAAAQTNVTSLLATDIKIGEDDQTKIDFETADEIHFYANNVEQVYLGDNIFGPQSDSDVDLGSNSVRWKDAYVDSVTVTGNVSASGDVKCDELYVAQNIYHDNDANTGILFTSDTITIQENNVQSAKFGTTAGNSIGHASYRMNITGSQILMKGNITASGTISMSAAGFVQTPDIKGKGSGTTQLNVQGQITASGTISASGAISGPAGYRIFSKTGTTDGEGQGDICYFGSTTSMTAGAIYHWNSSGAWELADADDNTKCDGLLGVALGASSAVNGVLLRGTVTLDHDPGAVGDVIYLTTTAGDASATAPSGNGNIVRVLGYCLDASNGQIWFDPDKTFVEVTA